MSLGRSGRGPAYRWALCEEASSGTKEEMAEQFPEKGGKIPASKMPSRRGLSGHSPAPQKCKGAWPLPLPPPTGQEWRSCLGSSRPGQPLRSSSQQGGPSVPPSDVHPSPLVIQLSLPSLTLRHCPGDGGEERMEKTARSPKETSSFKSPFCAKQQGGSTNWRF